MNSEYRMKSFWCHSCQQEFLQNVNSENYLCTSCNSPLVEEIEAGNPHPGEFQSERPARTYSYTTVRTIRHTPNGVVYIHEEVRPSSQFFPLYIFPRPQYFTTNLDSIIEMISRNDPNHYGAPPAQEQAINSLQKLKGVQGECPVCQEHFEQQAELRKMPCGHTFHENCLVTWLKMHNTCPVCRYSLSAQPSESSPCIN